MKTVFIVICLWVITLATFTMVEVQPSDQVQPEKSLLIGLIPEQNIFDQLERYQPLADYISKRVGVIIKLKVLTRYGNVIDNFTSLGLDGAFFGSFTYALAHKKLGLEILARPEDIDGRSTYYGLILVRKDSGIKTITDMKGKRFAFVDKATTAGYLLPLAYFKEYGVEEYKAYLKETYFTGTHEDVILDVLNKKADIGAAKNTVYETMARANDRLKTELTILETSPEVPENGLAVRSGLSNSLKNSLKQTLLNMHHDPEGSKVLQKFGARRFIETTDQDYDPVFKYAEKINLNLSTYDYLNE